MKNVLSAGRCGSKAWCGQHLVALLLRSSTCANSWRNQAAACPRAAYRSQAEVQSHGRHNRRHTAHTSCVAALATHSAAADIGASYSTLPLEFIGQVMSASSNMVWVELDNHRSGHHSSSSSTPHGHSSDRSPSAHSDNSHSSHDGSSSSSSSSSNNNSDSGISSNSISNSSSGVTMHHSNAVQHSLQLPRKQLLCSIRTLLKKLNQTVLVGDRVRVSSVDWRQGRGQVEEVLQRQSELTDPAIANVDFALLVFALNNPPFEMTQVTRFLVSMEASGIPFRLLLNKADLVSDQELQERVAQVRSWGYEPLVASCEGEGQGLQEVLHVLAGKTSVIAGPSGVGKSSLINAIRLGSHRVDQAAYTSSYSPLTLPPLQIPSAAVTSHLEDNPSEADSVVPSDWIHQAEEVVTEAALPAVASRGGMVAAENKQAFLAVGELNRMGRGRHTTTAVTLIQLPAGGRLADTPGFSVPTLDSISSTDLASYFPDLQAAMEKEGGCQFSNCLHMHEPGCAVNSQEPHLDRYITYIKLLLDIQERETRDVKLLQAGKRAREGTAKLKAARGGRTRAEAKLDSSKHRRVSRTKEKQQLKQISWDD